MVAPKLLECQTCGWGGFHDYWRTLFAELQTEDPSYKRFNGQPDYSKPIADEFKCQKCSNVVVIERPKPS